MKSKIAATLLLAVTGCSTLHTQSAHLLLPTFDRGSGDLKPVVIDSVVDARDFSTIPQTSGPRLAPSTAQQLGEHGRATAIYGVGRGGFVTVLDQGTVADEVRDLVTGALQGQGYKVVSPGQAPATSPHLQVKVTEFWSYLPFNFGRALTYTQQMKAWIATDLIVQSNGTSTEFSVSGYGANIIQRYSEENIQETYAKAMAEYARNLDTKLSSSL